MKRKFLAEWDGPIEGYTVKYVSKWNYNNLFELQEMIHEGYLVFTKTKIKYANSVDNPSWFMSLYKTSLRNRLVDLTKRKIILESLDQEYNLGSYEMDGYLLVLINQAPEELYKIINLFIGGSNKTLSRKFKAWERKGGKKITGNKFLNHVLKLDTKISYKKLFEDYFEVI